MSERLSKFFQSLALNLGGFRASARCLEPLVLGFVMSISGRWEGAWSPVWVACLMHAFLSLDVPNWISCGEMFSHVASGSRSVSCPLGRMLNFESVM